MESIVKLSKISADEDDKLNNPQPIRKIIADFITFINNECESSKKGNYQAAKKMPNRINSH